MVSWGWIEVQAGAVKKKRGQRKKGDNALFGPGQGFGPFRALTPPFVTGSVVVRDVLSSPSAKLLAGSRNRTMPTESIEGISRLTDAQGRAIAVQIDLETHRELWEDFEDALAAEQRRDEPTIACEEYRRRRARDRTAER